MKLYVLFILFCALSTVFSSPYVTFAQKSEIQNEFGKSTDQTQPYDTLDNNIPLLAQMYTLEQIDEMIYRLQDDIQNNNTESGHFQAIVVLLNLICYDKYYENVINACESVAKIPIK